MAKLAMTQDEQLEDLQRRFTLLEGERKATFETAKLNINQNKEIVKQMKGENKLLREQIAQLRTDKPQPIDKMLDEKMADVQKLQRRFDAMHAENVKKQSDLDNLDGKLNELKADANMPRTEASPEMRQIRVLENRLDKATIKYNETQSIRKTYELITKRLKEERIGFENKLAGIERTLKAKERDYEELLLLSHDAYHSKEMAQAELHRFEQGVVEERNQRDKEVQDKKVLVQQRIEMNQRLEQRERMLKKQQDHERGGEQQIKNMSLSSDLTSVLDTSHAQGAQSKANDYEDAFRRIRDATGVSDVNEVIQKFLAQEQTHKKLADLTRSNQARIDQLTEERRKLQLQVEEIKFSSGGNVGRRKAIDDFEDHLHDASEKFERNRTKYERLATMLIHTKAGIHHLSEKLNMISLEDAQQYEMTDETVVDVLQQCELRLAKLLTRTRDWSDSGSRKLDDVGYEERLLAKSASDVRIKVHDEDVDGDDDDDDFEDDVDEEVCNREHVKYMSEQLIEKEQTRKRRKAKTKRKEP